MYAYGVFTGSDEDRQTLQQERPRLQLTKTPQRMRVAAGFTENGLCVHSPHPFPCKDATGQGPASAGTMKSTYWERYLWTSFSNSWNIQHCIDACAQSVSCVQLFANPWTVAVWGSSVRGISQARILESVAISSSRGSSHPGIEPASPASPALQVDSLPLSHLRSLVNLSVHLAYFFQGWIPPLCSLVEHCKGLFLGAMLKGTADYQLPSHVHQDGGVCSRLKHRWASYLHISHKLKALQLCSRPEQFPSISIHPNFIAKYILPNYLRGRNGQILSLVGFSLGRGLCCLTLIRKLNGRGLDARWRG